MSAQLHIVVPILRAVYPSYKASLPRGHHWAFAPLLRFATFCPPTSPLAPLLFHPFWGILWAKNLG
jgi:hypothetical protein